MARFWRWMRLHSSLVTSLSVGLALVTLIGGTAAGVRASGTRSGNAYARLDAQPVAARVPASRHSVVGVVRAVGPGEFLVRNPRGVVFAVRWGPASRFRSAGKRIRPNSLHTGDRVVILGNAVADGTLRASVVTIVGQAEAVQSP